MSYNVEGDHGRNKGISWGEGGLIPGEGKGRVQERPVDLATWWRCGGALKASLLFYAAAADQASIQRRWCGAEDLPADNERAIDSGGCGRGTLAMPHLFPFLPCVLFIYDVVDPFYLALTLIIPYIRNM